MDRAQFVNGDEIVDYWGYLKSVSISIDLWLNSIKAIKAVTVCVTVDLKIPTKIEKW